MTVETTQRTQRALERIEETFGQGRNLAAEYPLVFGPEFPGSLVGLEKDGDVISACAILPRDLVCNGWLLRMGLIGSVTTAEEFRGQGLAGQLLERAEQTLFCDGAVFSMLWADDPKFYASKGYVPMGLELDYRFTPDMAGKLPEPEGVRWMQSRDHDGVHGLYVRHSHRMDRNLAETSALLCGPEMTSLVCEQEGEIVGYIVMGRGKDLQGVIHEWGGSTKAVLACVRVVLDSLPQGSQGLFLMCPATAVDMRKTLLDLEVPALEGVLAMGRVIDLAGMAQVFRRFGDPRLKVEQDSNHVRLTGPNGTVTLDRKQCLLATMPPQGNRGVIDAMEAETGIRFDGLPLYPFAWGLDSI